LGGEDVAWGEDTHLLASIFDVLAMANWQRQGKANAPRPKPLPRPGVKASKDKRLGTAMTALEWEERRRARLARGKRLQPATGGDDESG
jgi:hypothetical protein